jgi:hypothetical protein
MTPTLAVLLVGILEVWPASIRGYYQHHMRGEVRVEVQTAWIRISGWMGLGWWGRPDAKIRGSVLNLEATRTLERTYGAQVLVGQTVGIGLRAARRGVDELDRPRAWGDKVMDETHRWSIGYHDGLRPVAFVGPITVEGPYLAQWNSGTVPWHDWGVTAAHGPVDIVLGFGGRRRGFVCDLGIVQPVADGLALGLRIGTVELPGWGRDQFRAAFTARVWGP